MKEDNNKIDVISMAKKKRHIHLLEKMHKGKSLTSGELGELERFEGKPLPPGIVRRQEDVAKALKVSLRTVQYLARDGMPKTEHGYYDLAEIQKWRLGKSKGGDKLDKKNPSDWDEEYRKRKAQLMELQYKEATGELLPREEVERGRVARILAVKRAFLALPRAAAPQLVGLEPREIEAFLMERVRDIITRFAESGNEKKKANKNQNTG